ncbi:MAG: DUF58 domain-containing protein [Treponema sp.]|nr:DUF58 domain-containing protein [Treponema sp.]
MLDNDSLVKKAAYLRIVARDLADGMKSGSFRSLYHGQGIEFSGVRDYIRGDDVRSIDWNVTARMGRPYVKVFEEERELQIFLIVDKSASMQLGTGKRTKYEAAAETAALITIAAEMNACPIGAVFFDGDISFSCSPKLGREQTMLILTHLDKVIDKVENGSVLGNAITGTGKLLKRRTLIFVLSDFRTFGWKQPLVSLAQKHDVVALRVLDKFDEQLPAIGAVPFVDCESGVKMVLPTNSENLKKEWRVQNEGFTNKWQEICTKHGIMPVKLNTSDEPLQVISSVFSQKGRN